MRRVKITEQGSRSQPRSGRPRRRVKVGDIVDVRGAGRAQVCAVNAGRTRCLVAFKAQTGDGAPRAGRIVSLDEVTLLDTWWNSPRFRPAPGLEPQPEGSNAEPDSAAPAGDGEREAALRAALVDAVEAFVRATRRDLDGVELGAAVRGELDALLGDRSSLSSSAM